MEYTVELSNSEKLGMEYICDPQEWMDNAFKNRARIAIDEICSLLMTHCNENNIAMAVGKEAQVTQAFELGVVIKASEIAID
tara:strand:+ start:463 stop:708 length:246 start_codon:yes stop_codon:yes gene_type:complete